METNKMYKRLAASLISVTTLMLAAACGSGDGASREKSPTAAASTASSASPTKVAASPTAASATSIAAVPDVPVSPTAAVPGLIATPEPVIPTTAPVPTEAPPPPPPPTDALSVTIAAVNTTFSVTSLTLPAGATVTLTFDNQDAGVTHDFLVYDASGAVIGATELADGPIMQTVAFTLGGPGNYAFKCSVHPQQMRGFIKVQ